MAAMIAALLLTAPVFAEKAVVSPPSGTFSPYAQLIVERNDATGEVILSLATSGKPGGDVAIKHVVKNGVEIWTQFAAWYEELFNLTYLDSNFSRLWQKLWKRCATLADDFLDDELLAAIKGSKLLVVVDETYPFPIDAFRVGDQWLFEIVPIVHAATPGPKDLTDSTRYQSALVLDCQGPKDREGAEAPGVYAILQKLPGVTSRLITSLTRDETVKNLSDSSADILHLATHAHPDEFFPGRIDPGVKAAELEKMTLRFHTILSTGCHTGNPVFGRGVLHGETKFLIASMYTTSGKDGISLGGEFYKALFSGSTPFEAFYAAKQRIAGNKSDFPDILRFVFFVK